MEKKLFTDVIEEKKGISGGSLLLVLLILVGLFFIYYGIEGIQETRPGTVRQESNNTDGTSLPLKTQDTVMQIQQLEKEVRAKRQHIFKLISDYRKKTGKSVDDLNLMDLSEREKQLFKERITGEKSMSTKALLAEILDQSDHVRKLKSVITDLEQSCPAPVLVKAGENHFQIALDYLVRHENLEKKKAIRLVKKAVLLDHLTPGFKVWNLFDRVNGTFGTYVTQGSATVSPGKMHRIIQERIRNQKDKAIEEKERLATDNAQLREHNLNLNGSIAELNDKQSRITSELMDLTERHLELDRKWHSLFYLIADNRQLIEDGVLKRGFLRKTRLDQFHLANYETLDLRKGNHICVQAEQFNSKRIKRLKVYPKFYKKGIDYEVKIDREGSEAIVTILTPEKLKNERVVIALACK